MAKGMTEKWVPDWSMCFAAIPMIRGRTVNRTWHSIKFFGGAIIT